MLLARALAAAAAARLAAARVYTGSTSGQTTPFLAKFAFGVDASGAAVGSAAIQYSIPGADTGLSLYSYDDDAWAGVYPNKATCQQAAAAANSNAPLPAPGSSVTVQIQDEERPHYWFFTLGNADCSGVYADWTLTLTQADGSQLSYDEVGLPSAYGVFWAVYLVGLAGHVYLHYARRPRFAPLLVLLLTWSLALQMLSLTAHMIDWARVVASGVGVPFFAIVGGLARVGASLTLWAMAGLAANGFGISTYALSSRDNWRGLALLASAIVSYLALIIWYTVTRDPASTSNIGSAWPAIILLAVTLLYLGWFIFRVRATIAGETHTLKRRVLLQLAFALGANFVVRRAGGAAAGGAAAARAAPASPPACCHRRTSEPRGTSEP